MESFVGYGFLGLFVGSFLAATILPFSSEILFSVLLLNGFDPLNAMVVATAGNTLGSVVNYALGFWGNTLLLKKFLRLSPEDIGEAQRRFRKYGILSLCFAWVPVVGDPLTVAAGLLKIHFVVFLTLVTAGKLARYAVLALSFVS
jgi:membrane protein YqaA with SNARE-associated domain